MSVGIITSQMTRTIGADPTPLATRAGSSPASVLAPLQPIDFGLASDGTSCVACQVGQPAEDAPYSSGWWKTVWAIASVLSVGASAYHGYRRNDSVGWAIWWGLMGGIFPVVTPAIALAQGFGQPKRG